jgi:hypothetical protein
VSDHKLKLSCIVTIKKGNNFYIDIDITTLADALNIFLIVSTEYKIIAFKVQERRRRG